MKITRLKRGYRISLTDTEYHLMISLVGEGIGGYFEGVQNPEETSGLTRAECRAFFKRGSGGQFMRVDEDRRNGV